MWQKFKEQIPAVILTALLVVGGAFWLHQQATETSERAESRNSPPCVTNDALRRRSDENRRQIEATNKLLRDAIAKREADMFRTDEEMKKLNGERMDALAEAIAKKVQPYNPLAEVGRGSGEHAERAGGQRLQPHDRPHPADPRRNGEGPEPHPRLHCQYSQRISDQVGTVLTAELAKNQQLNNNLQATQAVAAGRAEALARNHRPLPQLVQGSGPDHPPAHIARQCRPRRREPQHRHQQRSEEGRAAPREQNGRHRQASHGIAGTGAHEISYCFAFSHSLKPRTLRGFFVEKATHTIAPIISSQPNRDVPAPMNVLRGSDFASRTGRSTCLLISTTAVV